MTGILPAKRNQPAPSQQNSDSDQQQKESPDDDSGFGNPDRLHQKPSLGRLRDDPAAQPESRPANDECADPEEE